MRLLSTAVLLLISISLGVLIAVVDREPSSTDSTSPGLSLTRFPGELVDQIAIEMAEEEAILLKKDTETGKWSFTTPIEDRANDSTITALLDSLNHLTIQDEIYKDEVGATEEMTAENLGLDGKNVIRVTLQAPREVGGAERDNYVVLIGNDAPQSNTIYARLIDDERRPNVYVVNGNPRRYLEKPMVSLRDQELLETSTDQIVRIVAKTPRGNIEVTRKITAPPIPWRITKPIEARANASLLEEILTEVTTMSIVGVLKTGELPGPPPNPMPDDSVAMDIYSYGSAEPVTVYFTPSDKEPPVRSDGTIDGTIQYMEVSVSDRPAVFLVESDLLKEFPDSLTAFRDRHLANIPPQLVGQIFIKSPTDPPVRLEMHGNRLWKSIRNNEVEAANVEQINKLLNSINSELIVEFAADTGGNLEDFGLKEPAVQIAFRIRNPLVADPNSENAVVTKILDLGYGDIAGETLFARFEDETFVYQVDPSFSVPTNPMKWKDTKVLSFNRFNLQSIERERLSFEDEIPVRLEYDFRQANWKAFQDDEEVTEKLNRAAANDLMTDLGSLRADTWVTSRGAAYAALENPAARYRITLREHDPASNQTREVEKTVIFAKALISNPEGEAGYYGQIEGSPDVFLIQGSTVRKLLRPLVGAVVRPE